MTQPEQNNSSKSEQQQPINHPSDSPNPANPPHSTSTPTTKNTDSKGVSYVVVGLMLLIGIGMGMVLGKYWDKTNSHPESAQNSTTTTSDGNQTNTSESSETPVLTVEVLRPQISQVATRISADGIVTAKNTASVSSKVNGMAIESIRVQAGQWVNKGDVLATFDAKTLRQNAIQAEANVRQAQAQVKQSQASVIQAEVNLTKSQADLNRVLPLLKIGAISQQQVDSYQAQFAQAKASLVAAQQAVTASQEAVISAKAQLNNQTLNLIDTQLLAPVSGIISTKTAQIGSIPQGTLFTIIEDGQLEWQADLNPEKVRQLQVGSMVTVNINNEKSVQGKVNRIDPVANSSRQIPVYVTLQSSQGLQSGMLLTGEFITGIAPQTILPVSAITSDDGYNYLMAVTDINTHSLPEEQLTTTAPSATNTQHTTGRIHKLQVKLGRQENNAVIVKTPLTEDTLVVRQGGSFLSDGDLVRVVTVGDK